jgi:DNA-binding transcriptional regulator YiaG
VTVQLEEETMPNIGSVLREEISRLSRREVRKLTTATKTATTIHRRHIAALHRRVRQLERDLAALKKKGAPSAQASAAAAKSAPLRFVAKGLRSHRRRLGLSANEFGKLIGVSANSVYAWEGGSTAPRKEQVAKIAALRAVGKREAAQKLAGLRSRKGRPARAG